MSRIIDLGKGIHDPRHRGDDAIRAPVDRDDAVDFPVRNLQAGMHPALTVAAWPLVYKLPNMQRVDVLRQEPTDLGRRAERWGDPVGRSRRAVRAIVVAPYRAVQLQAAVAAEKKHRMP